LLAKQQSKLILKSRFARAQLLLGLMNSTLWEWRFRCVSQTNHVNAYDIAPFRIPNCLLNDSNDARRIETLAELACKSTVGVWRADRHQVGIDDEIDQEIDALVFEAYGIQPDEARIIQQRAWGNGVDAALLGLPMLK
jgi:hypothetical protein